MIRRRLQPGVLNPQEVQNKYEKDRKGSHRTSLPRLSLGAIAIIFVLSLLMLVYHLDSIASTTAHLESGQEFTSASISRFKNDEHKKAYRVQSSTTNTTNIGEIPYILYNETLSVNTIKARMDYAISHGDAENPNNPNNTIGQHLLDFGIVGFPKCGTTTMSKFDINCHYFDERN